MIIRGGKIIPGDGRTSIDNGFVMIREGKIIDIGPGPGPRIDHEETYEAHSRLVIPGIINSHSHACAPGPFVPTAGPPRTLEQVRGEHNRHLLAGETTVLHLCGFCLQEEVELIKDWPLHVEVGTSHLPSAIKAAQIVDGRGLSKAHLDCTARKRIAEGAAAIGEIGAGQTLGGGGADYQVIPQAVQKATGAWLRPDQARQLKWAVLGKNLRKEAFDPKQTSECLAALGLGAKLTASEPNASSVIVCFPRWALR